MVEKNTLKVLSAAIKKARDMLSNELRAFNITFDQWVITAEIFNNQGISQTMLCNVLEKDKASVSRTVKTLISKQLILKKQDALNGRKSKLYLTPEGIELMKEAKLNVNRAYRKVFANIHEREMNLLLDVLSRI